MTNRLAAESSLYLRQHADNPVAWQPWDAAALASARASDTPILLSIGYSACHWCHVMAHESFEDAATGALMNRLFVNVKVDREERPDLDRIYQLAHQALTRRGGGWPLTLFLDPHTLLPFYAGTYFPPAARHGLPAFAEVLQGVRRWWDEQRGQVTEQNSALQGFLADYGREGRHAGELSEAPLALARERLLAGLDRVNGGHRGAPKFPHAGEVELLLALAAEGDADAAQAASVSLAAMAGRGLHDHLAGGFFRYCVDAQWDIPHFEKMLYDNALLLPAFAQAARRFGAPALGAAAEGIVAWLQAEMRLSNSGYCSALDADSEGEEGRFYLWTRAQFDDALAPALRDLAARRYGLDRPPNFEGQAWHLHAVMAADALAATGGGDAAAISSQLDSARAQLLAARAQRVRPARDDKCLTAWNALLCSGLARAGQALAREDWLDEATAVFAAITRDLDARGRLPAVLGRDGPGFLDDHAYALAAAMDLLAVRGSAGVLHAARQLADALLRDFADVDNGGFFFTAVGHEPLPQRPKPWLDDATPAGNGVAAEALLRLGALLAEPRYLDAAEATLRAAWTALTDLPQAAPALLMALRELQRPTPLVVIRGDVPALAEWRRALESQAPRPIRIYAFAEPDKDLPPALATKPRAATGRAVLCVGTSCLAEAGDAAMVVAQLRAQD